MLLVCISPDAILPFRTSPPLWVVLLTLDLKNVPILGTPTSQLLPVDYLSSSAWTVLSRFGTNGAAENW